MSWLRSTGRWLARSPGAQLVLGALILAVAFPARASGSVGLLVLGGAIGIAAVLVWPRAPAWLRSPPENVSATLVICTVAVVGVAVFHDALTQPPDWQMGDWGPQHAVLAGIVPSLPGFDLPVWNHAISTGDAPLELYPSLAYLVAGYVAVALGLTHQLPLALMITAVVVHVTIAAATAAITMQVAPRPIAVVVGVLMLVDTGAIAHGGTVGLFGWALLHSALALACATILATAILAALRQPRLAVSVTIWITAAITTAAHPAGLIAAAASMVALAAVALLAADLPPRRALAALGHVALGAALAAFSWMPLAARILAYGQHYSNPLHTASSLLNELLAQPLPVTAYAAFEYAGYAGILVGLWSRRAAAVFVAASGFVLLLGLCDTPYLAFDLAPGLGIARLGTERLAQLARPFVWAASGYGLAILGGYARSAWRGAPRNRQLAAAAILGVICLATLRATPSVWAAISERAAGQTRVYAPDRASRDQLEEWATARVREIKPDAWARTLFDEDTHEHFHLTAKTGLPSLHLPPEPDMLLRERIEDASEASLRRFNVRWVVSLDHSPTIGDPDSEQIIGRYHIREIENWDGKFARIERGEGEVTVTRLDDRAVEVDVTAHEPVLVALGTGYYPRWRARHASGADEPVYAYPSVPGGQLHVVAAWLAPGHTTFTVDGPLPSDHDGRALSILAALVAIAGTVIWLRPRWRHRALLRLVRLRRRWPGAARIAIRIGVPLVLLILVGRGCRDAAAPTRALEVGAGIRPIAQVEARLPDSPWQTCGYTAVTATYDCSDLVTVYDATATLINDAAPSWGFITPAITAVPVSSGVELRVTLRARLAGTYWLAVSDAGTRITVDGFPAHKVLRETHDYPDVGDRPVVIEAQLSSSTWQFTCVRDDTLIPPRPFLAPPPELPPAAIRAIH